MVYTKCPRHIKVGLSSHIFQTSTSAPLGKSAVTFLETCVFHQKVFILESLVCVQRRIAMSRAIFNGTDTQYGNFL